MPSYERNIHTYTPKERTLSLHLRIVTAGANLLQRELDSNLVSDARCHHVRCGVQSRAAVRLRSNSRVDPGTRTSSAVPCAHHAPARFCREAGRSLFLYFFFCFYFFLFSTAFFLHKPIYFT